MTRATHKENGPLTENKFPYADDVLDLIEARNKAEDSYYELRRDFRGCESERFPAN